MSLDSLFRFLCTEVIPKCDCDIDPKEETGKFKTLMKKLNEDLLEETGELKKQFILKNGMKKKFQHKYYPQ